MRATVFIGLLAVCCSLGPATLSADQDAFDEGVEVGQPEAATEEDDASEYASPNGPSDPSCVHLWEHFDDAEAVERRWVRSAARKASGADEQVAQYDGEWSVEAAREHALRGDLALVLKSKARHAAIAAALDRPFRFREAPVEALVVQYEVAFQEGQECGGAYLKLLSAPPPRDGRTRVDLASFRDATPYTIMFGPDKCGNDHKLHFIFRYESPVNGSVAERHLTRRPDERLDELFRDRRPHLYRLVVHAEGARYELSVDGRALLAGSLLEDFEPPVNPPAEIDDPTDVRPADWDERELVPDATATKPADWDEEAPPRVPDATAVKPPGWLDDEPAEVGAEDARRPDDWDDEMDGEWEAPRVENPRCAAAPGCGEWSAPLVPNPAYRGGKWRAPLVPNPAYRGTWRPRRLANPHAYVDERPFRRLADIDALGFELWTMSGDVLFDNVLVASCERAADELAAVTWRAKRDKRARDAESLVSRLLSAADERPWLWPVYVLAVALPVSLFLYLCCRKQSPVAPSQTSYDPQAHHKKTDGDDEEQQQQKEEEEAEGQDVEVHDEKNGETAGDTPPDHEIEQDIAGASARRRRVRKE